MLLALTLLARADLLPLDPTPPADALAERVAAACGDPYALSELAFTFVLTRDGVEQARRAHTWSPREGWLEVRWEGFEARLTALDPPTPAEGTTAAQAREAHAAFTNDAYWLLAPCKVMDAGVRRALDEDGRLLLSFDGVGLTPGDRYALTVHPHTAEVTRWSFVLESGREGDFAWNDHARVGPLSLSTRRVSADGRTELRFEALSAR